jgi:hypothetical protein
MQRDQARIAAALRALREAAQAVGAVRLHTAAGLRDQHNRQRLVQLGLDGLDLATAPDADDEVYQLGVENAEAIAQSALEWVAAAVATKGAPS